MAKLKTINRTPILLEVLHNGNVINNGATGGNGSATNVTYGVTDKGYQTQHGIYGASSVTTFTAVNSTRGCHFRIYPTANTKTILQLTTTTGLVTIDGSNIITITGASNTVVYVNNVQTTTVTLNAWNDVVISWDSYNCANPAIGNNSFLGNIGVVRFFNTVPTQQEIQTLYQEGLRQLSGIGYGSLFDGLITYFDGQDEKEIIQGNVSTLTGTYTNTTDRFGGNRARSLGSVGTTELRTSTKSNASTSQISMHFWYNSSLNSSSEYRILAGLVSGRMVAIGNRNQGAGTANKLRVGTLREGVAWDGTQIESASDFNDGNWNFWSVTKNGATIKIYKNGTLDATSTGMDSQALDTTQGFLYTGVTASNGECFIFNREQTADEVKALYTASSQRYLLPYSSNLPKNLQNGLVMWLNEQGADISGNGNSATLVNTPLVARRIGEKGLSYNGSNQYATITNTASLQPATTLTINTFIYLTSAINTSSLASIISMGNTISGGGYGCTLLGSSYGAAVNNKLEFYTDTGGTVRVVDATYALELNKWYMVSCVYDGATMKLYINGTLHNSGSYTGNISYSGVGTLTVGRYSGVSARYFPGNILNPMIYNRALSATEIQILYNSLYIK